MNEQLQAINYVKDSIELKKLPYGFQVRFSPSTFELLNFIIAALIVFVLAFLTIKLLIFVGVRVFDDAVNAYNSYKKSQPQKKFKEIAQSVVEKVSNAGSDTAMVIAKKNKGGRPKKK